MLSSWLEGKQNDDTAFEFFDGYLLRRACHVVSGTHGRVGGSDDGHSVRAIGRIQLMKCPDDESPSRI